MIMGRFRPLSPYWYIVFAIVIRSITQVLFKLVAVGPSGENYLSLFMSPLFYIVCGFFVLLTWTWQMALAHFPLSFVYPFTSIVFVTLLITSSLIFKEQITLTNILGATVIVIGIIIVSSTKGKIQANND